jgi:hypothetical protein
MIIRSFTVTVVFAVLTLASAGLSATQAEETPHEKARKELKAKYGVEPYGWLGWADEPVEKSLRELVRDVAAKQAGLSASALYTIAIGEGLNRWIDVNLNSDRTVNLKASIDGYGYLGVDDFHSDVVRLRATGVLADSFKEGTNYIRITRKNEQGREVQSARFPTLADGLTALAAMIAHRRGLVRATPEGGNLDADNDFFWTYAFFVDGEGDGKEHIKAAKGDFTKSTRETIKDKSLRRLVTMRFVDKFVAF